MTLQGPLGSMARQEQWKCLLIQLFPNSLARQLVKLKLPPTLGTNAPGFAFPTHTLSLFPEKISACWLGLPAVWLAPA